VGGATSAGDDGLQAALACLLGIAEHVVGHAVGRHHAGFMGHAEVGENLGCYLHGVPVTVGPHDNTNHGRGAVHGVLRAEKTRF